MALGWGQYSELLCVISAFLCASAVKYAETQLHRRDAEERKDHAEALPFPTPIQQRLLTFEAKVDGPHYGLK
jgi:hypothetical protein